MSKRQTGQTSGAIDFDLLFAAAPDLYLVLAPDFTIVGASDAYLRTTLTRREEVWGRRLFDVFPDNPDEADATGVKNLNASLERVLRTKAADSMGIQKYDIPRPESAGGGFEVRFWRPLNTPVLSGAGEVRYIIHKVEDVTETVLLRDQEAAQREELKAATAQGTLAEERFRLLVEGTRDYAIFMLDPDGRVGTWNSGAERIKGYAAAEILGSHFSCFYPADEVRRGKPEAGLKTAAETGRYEEEGQRLRKDGSTFEAHVVITALRDADGRLHGFSKVTRDVTERKRAAESERRLLQEEASRRAAEELAQTHWNYGERLRVTLRSIGDGVITTDASGRVAWLNPVAERLTGWTEEEARGLPLTTVFEIIREGSREQVENPAVRAQREGVIVGLANHTLLISRDGTERPIADSAAPILEASGKIVGVVLVFRDHSDQRAAERRLQESEAKFQAFMNRNPAWSWMTETDGRFAFVNDSFAQAVGRGAAKPIGEAIGDVLPPALAAIHEEGYRTVMAEGRFLDRFEPGIRPNGSPGEFRVLRFPLTLRGASGVGGIGLDVTEERQAQRALQAGEQALRHLVEGIRDYAIFAMDPTGAISSWSPGAIEMFGYFPEEIIGRHRNALFVEEDVRAGLPQQALDDAARTGKVEESGWRVRRDGSRFWSQGSMSALRDAEGKLFGFVKVLQDRTEQRELEAELRLRDRVFASASQGILITDPTQPDHPITFANLGFERLTGYPAAEIVGRNCRFLQGEGTDPEVVARLREAIRSGRECSVEILNYRKSGEPFWNALFISPVRDDDGRLVRFVGLQADVTERRRLEQALHQSQKMESVGMLAGGVAHDFNNLLLVVLAACGFLEQDATLTPDSRDLVAEVRKAGERAARLTQQLLAFSRRQILRTTVLNLNDVVHDIGKMLERLLGEDVSLTSVQAAGLWSVQADRGQLEQVLVNLALNARDAMPRGGKLTIETANVELRAEQIQERPDLPPGPYVVLSLTDTGSGMDRQTQARLFEPFFTTKEQGKGTGLGLATAFGIVKQSNGYITVYSELGIGTTFRIYLPKHELDREAATDSHVPTAPPRGSETVLVVEDEESVRQMTCRILRSSGYTVLEAQNGREALRLFEEHHDRIRLVLTDVVMPEMSGRVLAEALKRVRPDVKILYMSGYTDDAVVRHGVLEAEVDFLQKPFLPGVLAEKVRAVLDEAP